MYANALFAFEIAYLGKMNTGQIPNFPANSNMCIKVTTAATAHHGVHMIRN